MDSTNNKASSTPLDPAAWQTNDMSVGQLVAEVYASSPAPLRSRLLAFLLRPLGVLALVAIADGIFAKIRFRSGWPDPQVALEDANRVQPGDIAALVERVGADRAVDFAPLLGLLGLVQQVCARVAPAPAQATQAGAGGAERGVDADRLAPQTEEGMSGEIRNRDDALRMLDTVIEYFERNEPTNPAPLLIRRARRLVSMNFVDIIRDMAPESLKQIESIAGAEQKD